MTERIWKIPKPDKELGARLAKECGITPVIAQLLINRDIKDARAVERFLRADISFLHDPFLLKDMTAAVERIKKAVSKGEKIMVYGDYDVDGISAAALLKRVLRDLGGHVTAYIPDRIEEGYGLNKEAVKTAHREKVSLLITVDCGISGKTEVEYLTSLGITAIITDHHKISEGSFPSKAYAVINPMQKDCPYPFKHLSGVAVAYKLAQALVRGSGYDINSHLDLVALGTIQDMVPQLDENRILTRRGLIRINNTDKEGIRALIEVSGLKGKTISAREVGYMLGPRINAAGRVSSAKIALRLLMTEDKSEASKLAGVLNRENKNRQRIGSSILREAVNKVENEVNFKEEKVIVLEGDDWHPGVIGIVASRIAEKFNRPTVMVSFDGGDEGRGSGRSVRNFHLFEALTQCRDFLTRFGGHASACGLGIMRKDLNEFRARLNTLASGRMEKKDLIRTLDIDMELSLRHLSPGFIAELERISPHGPGNPPPIFSSRTLRLKSRPRYLRREGVKLWLSDGSVTCEAIGFGMNDMIGEILQGDSIDVAYSPSINRWGGLETLQLELVDVKANLI